MYCAGCKEEHTSPNWKWVKDGWYCALYFKPTKTEFVPERIKSDREEYFNSIVQPYRGGQLSKEFVDAHGADATFATKEEISKAKDVWKDLPGWENRHKSK